MDHRLDDRGVLRFHTWSMFQPTVFKELGVAIKESVAIITLFGWWFVSAGEMRVVGGILDELALTLFASVRHPNNERAFERVFILF